MNIAELFVNLGIKGSEKTVGALTSVKKGLGEVSSMSLEAKAGILAALYGFERMMSLSGQTGQGLVNFANLTGLSAKQLQQWEYAARQAGVSADELTGNVKAIQNSMTNMLLGKGAPEGLNVIQATVGLDMKKVRDPFYVMQQLQKAAQTLPPDAGNIILKSFGLSEGVISAMRRNMFTPNMFKQAPLYSDREIGNLSKADTAWKNLGAKIEMAFGHFNAKHGVSLVNDITKVADAIFKMADAFTVLAEKLKFFQVIGKVFEGWALIFNQVTGAVGRISNDKAGAIHGLLTEDLNMVKGVGSWAASGVGSVLKDRYNTVMDQAAVARNSGGHVDNSHNVNVTQTITHNGDAKDTKAVKDVHKIAVNQAYRQRPSQRQGP